MNRYAIVNYHYIRNDPGIKGCDPDLFRQHLDYLVSEYAVLGVEAVCEAAAEERAGKFCAITFDDGLKEHAVVAANELKSRGLTGTFFIVGATLKEKRISATHKLHFILAKGKASILADRLTAFTGGRYTVPTDRRLNEKRRFDDVITANLKEVLIQMPPDERMAFVDEMFRVLSLHEEGMADIFFLNEGDIHTMQGQGMHIAAHGWSHLGLDTLPASAQRQEIERGQNAVSEVTGFRSPLFSYANGRYTDETFALLAAAGIRRAFILGARDMTREDNPFAIPRFDANDVTKTV
jgi:peptidoglycan/xylan/chitin deacetylase (PgdA/CDA1 family)